MELEKRVKNLEALDGGEGGCPHRPLIVREGEVSGPTICEACGLPKVTLWITREDRNEGDRP